MAPAASTAAILRAQRMNRDIAIWSRGIDRDQFNPDRRDMAWRRSLGIPDDEMVVVFLGRVVMEKGLDVFADAIHVFIDRGIQAPGAGHRRWPGDAVVRTAIARRDLHRSVDRRRSRARGRQFRRPSKSVDHRGVRQRHAGGDGLRPARDRRGGDGSHQPGPRRRHRHPGRRQRHRRLRRRARSLCARPRTAPPPRRGRPRLRQDDGLGPDQFDRASGLPPRDHQAPAAGANDRGGSSTDHLVRSIFCAASSRIPAISCSRSSSSPSRPMRWRSAVIKFLTARPIAGPALLPSRGARSRSRSSRASTSSSRSSRCLRPSSVTWNGLRGPSPGGLLDQAHVLEQASASDR